jgi:tetratricopeptide (TPR) repeat protein
MEKRCLKRTLERVISFLVLLPISQAVLAQNPGRDSHTQHQSQEDYARGVQLQQIGDLQNARLAYEAALKLDPRRVDALSNLGLLFSQLGLYEQAISHYRKALSISPKLHAVRYHLGAAFFQAQQFDKAIQELMQVVEKQPINLQARQLLALSYLRLNKLAEGIAQLENILASQPENLGAAYTLGSAYITNHQLDKVEALIEKFFDRLDSAEAHLIKGSYRVAVADYPKAVEELSRAKELNEKLPTVRSQLGFAQLYLGNRDAASSEFQAELHDNPLDFTANACLGWLHKEEGRTDAAIAMLKQAFAVKPEDSGVLFQLAGLAQAKGESGKAIGLLEQVVQQRPHFIPAHVLLARMYYQAKRLPEAQRERKIIDQLNAEEQNRQPSASNGQERYSGNPVPMP